MWCAPDADRVGLVKSVLEGAEALGFSGKELPSEGTTRMLLQLPAGRAIPEGVLNTIRTTHGVLAVETLARAHQLQVDFTREAAPRDLVDWLEAQLGAPVRVVPPAADTADDREASRWGVLTLAAALLAIPVLFIEQVRVRVRVRACVRMCVCVRVHVHVHACHVRISIYTTEHECEQ